MRLITIGSYRERLINYWRQRRAITAKSKDAQMAKEGIFPIRTIVYLLTQASSKRSLIQ